MSQLLGRVTESGSVSRSRDRVVLCYASVTPANSKTVSWTTGMTNGMVDLKILCRHENANWCSSTGKKLVIHSMANFSAEIVHTENLVQTDELCLWWATWTQHQMSHQWGSEVAKSLFWCTCGNDVLWSLFWQTLLWYFICNLPKIFSCQCMISPKF